MKRRSILLPLVLIVLVALGSIAGVVGSGKKPLLGLDLQGGFSVVLQAKKTANGKYPPAESIDKAKDIIRQRVDGLGVAEPDITRQGRTVVVQLPGVKNRQKAESLVGCTARLEFRPTLAVSAAAPTTTTVPKTTTTTKPKTTTTKGESGMGAVGISGGEGALPAQLLPSTTTTTTTTTTTRPPPTTTTRPGATTTTRPTTTTTTIPKTAPAANQTSSCGGATGSVVGAVVKPTDSGTFPGDKDGRSYQLGPTGFSGDSLSAATAQLASTGGWEVAVNVRGKDQTKANAAFNACYQGAATCPSKAIAIVLDGKVISAPTVNAADLASNQFVITGNFDSSKAKDLALVLRYGSLPVEFEQVALQQVSATLGKDSLHAGLIAGGIGVALIACYMVLYYRGLGLVVVAGTFVWGALMYGIVVYLSSSRGLALTLSGITGIIVSVGTTVDSYIVYFERVKDDLRAGKTVRTATERGFDRALRTIVTANVSSFIGAFLLWWLTVGPVRGFAFFLGLSTLLDMVVIYLFARPLVILMGRSDFFVDTPFFGIARGLGRLDAHGGTLATGDAQ
ncbi:MAG: Protein translocase subunit SecD [Acidimicrobiales bacterium]|nr:Protein translocase subunit SecD [Acidimicrobiales bacterium]